MKIRLVGLFTALTTGLAATLFPSATLADSTADLITTLNCDDYYVEIWQNRTSGNYLYRAQGFAGRLRLDNGIRENTEGVTVYKFQNGNYQYWVWDGSLDSPNEGQLIVYHNNQQAMQRSCTK